MSTATMAPPARRTRSEFRQPALDVPTLDMFDQHQLLAHTERTVRTYADRLVQRGDAATFRPGGSAVISRSDRPDCAHAAVVLVMARTGARVTLRISIRPRVPHKVQYEVARLDDAAPALTGFPRWGVLLERLRNAALDAEAYVCTADPFDVPAAA